MTEQTATRPNYDDEIDLIELCKNLWREKITIITCTAIVTLIGVLYLLTTKPIYRSTAQIKAPTTAELATINNTHLIKLGPDQAFSELLYMLSSNKFKLQLAEQFKQNIISIKGVPEETLDNQTYLLDYEINYPALKKEDNLTPKLYTLSTTGTDSALTAEMLNNIISLASKRLIEKWRESFNLLTRAAVEKRNAELALVTLDAREMRENTISRLKEDMRLNIKQLEDKITSKKSYVLKNRVNYIIQLQEALKIAEALNIKQPSSLSSMSNLATSGQISVNTEIRSEKEPLYLRGSTLLKAELESMRNLPKDTFLDSGIIKLETELQEISNNRKIEILRARKSDLAFIPRLQEIKEEIRRLIDMQFPPINIDFQNGAVITPQESIKPIKILILAISIFLGGMLGFLVAVGRIILRKATKE